MNLKELAAHLGLSQTTVSRALGGYADVADATRHRVEKAALDLGYRPSSRAQSLATGKAMVIGHVLPVHDGVESINPIFADFITGSVSIYRGVGYDAMLSIVDASDAGFRDLHQRGRVDGIVLHGPRREDPRVAELLKANIPFVVHGRTEGLEGYSWVDVNNRRAFHRATEFLLDLGHRQIALINGPEEMDFAWRRKTGYLDALSARGIVPQGDHIWHARMTEGNGYAAAAEMLGAKTPPTAFMAASVVTALGIRRAIEDAGFKMGRDVSVVAHDDMLDYLRIGDDVPLFTATRSSVREAGSRAARLLLSCIQDAQRAPVCELMEAELTVGLSTGPAPQSRI